MKNIIQFVISREDGMYTAEGVNVPVVTEGETFEELQENIREAVALYFEDENPATLGFGSSPSLLASFELSTNLHGGRA